LPVDAALKCTSVTTGRLGVPGQDVKKDGRTPILF
jgi:hypothetical protein